MRPENAKMAYYIAWFTDFNGEEEYESYVVVQAENSKDAWKKAEEIAGDYVISVEPYNP